MEYRTLPDGPLTADDLLHLPEDDRRRTELVRGKLVRGSPTLAEHAAAAVSLGARLRDHVRERGLGTVFTGEVGFVLSTEPDTVRAPDVAFVSAERLPPNGPPRAYLRLAPDLAVEIPFPATPALAVVSVVMDYLLAGTRQVWVLDPASRTATLYRGFDDIRILTAEDELDGGDVAPGFRARVGEVMG